MLNLEKIDYTNYVKKETITIEYEELQQNIARSWTFLQKTHNLQEDECLCIRALATSTNMWDKFAIPKEHIIFGFNTENYERYTDFITKLVKSKRIYNFYYNTYNISKSKAVETCKENEGGFFGKTCNVSSTSMIIIDFDDMTHTDYLELKEDLVGRGLNTVDVMSGNGYHIIFRLKENCEDEQLLLKMIKVFQELGYTPDIQCQDAARIMRLPFFFNQKPKKYTTSKMAEIIDGEYKSTTYTVEEIFEKLGFDYQNFNLEEYYKEKRKVGRPKKIKDESKIEYNENVDIYKLYEDFNINLDELPAGIKNMMMGFRKGYSNLQTMILTVYFKRNGYSLEVIQKIMEVVEKINTNKWNDWDVKSEVERFYNNYNYINRYTLMDMEQYFGEIQLEYKEQMYKLPLGVMEPGQFKLYTLLLVQPNLRKKDIIEKLGVTKNTLDKMVKECNYITVTDRIYNVNTDVEINSFVYVNRSFIDRVLKLDKNEMSVYCYLYYRLGVKNQIRTSIQSIKNNCLISEKTITNTIKSLENLEKIKVERSRYNMKTESKESNVYTLLK